MSKAKTYDQLSPITKIKHRNAHLADAKALNERINSIVMKATTDNPVSILNLTKCSDFVRRCLMLGASDIEATDATFKFIKQLNGEMVG